jgi:hypothetical protein
LWRDGAGPHVSASFLPGLVQSKSSAGGEDGRGPRGGPRYGAVGPAWKWQWWKVGGIFLGGLKLGGRAGLVRKGLVGIEGCGPKWARRYELCCFHIVID